jgi:hypothetical protein
LKHAFSFPREVRDAVRRYIRERIIAVNPQRFNQEPNYVAALVHGLEGIAYEGIHGFVQFQATVFDDRGRNSAEHFLGADFAITADISSRTLAIQKAILFQAKLGSLQDLQPGDFEYLLNQIRRMKRFTEAPKVMEIIEEEGSRFPRIISGNRLLSNSPYTNDHLSDYIVRRVLTTLDGDTRPDFVMTVQESSLTILRILARTHGNQYQE